MYRVVENRSQEKNEYIFLFLMGMQGERSRMETKMGHDFQKKFSRTAKIAWSYAVKTHVVKNHATH